MTLTMIKIIYEKEYSTFFTICLVHKYLIIPCEEGTLNIVQIDRTTFSKGFSISVPLVS